jgi:glucokinase
MSTGIDDAPAVGDGAESETRAPVLALDIGGTKLAAGVVDGTGEVHSFVVVPTQRDEGPDAVLHRLWDLGRRAVEESGVAWAELGAVGIGCGGPLDAAAGVLIAPPHLPGWHDIPIAALAAEAYELPVVLENDATAAAAGEHRWGAGKGSANMVYLTISTGVGGGVVIDGRLYRGACGNGGELGHVTVDWHGRRCRSCGRLGCLEAYVSGTSIAERAREAGLDVASAEELAASAAANDALAARVWDETVEALACGVVSIVNLFEPELLVLGGGVTRSGDQLFVPLREQVAAAAMKPAGDVARIVPSAFGDLVGVVGAAAIVYDRARADERRLER